MKRNLLYIALLLVAAQGPCAEAQTYEGPWRQMERRMMVCDNTNSPSICVNNTNGDKWPGTVSGWCNSDGTGFTFQGRSLYSSKMGIFSTYKLEKAIPSYSYMKMTWTFRLGSLTTKHHSTTCLYGMYGSYADIIRLEVDFSNHYDSKVGAEYLLARLSRTDQTGKIKYTGDQTYSFDFDNRDGNRDRLEYWHLLLTHVMASDSGKEDLDEWGALKSIGDETIWSYRKIISFNANGGSGVMDNENIDDSGILTPNTFTRGSYNFLGWALSPSGEVVYTDQAAITAGKNDKGPVTLYAKWAPSTDGVMADIEAIGAPVTLDSRDAIHYAREGYDDLSAEQKTQVTNYAKLTNAEAAYNAVSLIHAIGKVVYSNACKTKINAARNAYNALSEIQKDLIPETVLRLLIAAEDNYSVLCAEAKIAAIGTVEYTQESKAKIDTARTYYDALTYPQKEIISASFLQTLQKAEADYASFDPSNIRFMNKDQSEQIDGNRQKAIYYPALPAGAFNWQTVEKDVSDKTIVIQAVE